MWFKREEINGHGACPTYLYRWELFRWGERAIYLHHFVGDDWSRDFHDHPKRFISIGLKGRYIEETPDRSDPSFPIPHHYKAPWIRTFPATHQHRIRLLPGQDCWTLVLVGKKVREWGFWHLGTFIPWREYVEDKNLVSSRKSCP